jgi:Domain of unknown function (DUF932)
MNRQPVDLNSHMNLNVIRGGIADFELVSTPVMFQNPATGAMDSFDSRTVITRADTGKALSVVSDRYSIVNHRDLLTTIESAIEGLDVGPVPRGIYLENDGRKMRAIFKFPTLERAIQVHALDRRTDRLCPLIKVSNSLDGTSRIMIEIGAFSFVCTNFAVGGSGIFAGGFMSIHQGNIALEAAADQMRAFLCKFDAILNLFAYWADVQAAPELHERAIRTLPGRYARRLVEGRKSSSSVFDVYNQATRFCTHDLRTANRAMHLLAKLNRGFQSIPEWMPEGYAVDVDAAEVEEGEPVLD